jgi:hypothetical protein
MTFDRAYIKLIYCKPVSLNVVMLILYRFTVKLFTHVHCVRIFGTKHAIERGHVGVHDSAGEVDHLVQTTLYLKSKSWLRAFLLQSFADFFHFLNTTFLIPVRTVPSTWGGGFGLAIFGLAIFGLAIFGLAAFGLATCTPKML